MNIETHIQTIGPVFNSNGTVSYDFQVIQWTDKFLPTGRREIYDSWRIVEDKNGKFIERIEFDETCEKIKETIQKAKQ